MFVERLARYFLVYALIGGLGLLAAVGILLSTVLSESLSARVEEHSRRQAEQTGQILGLISQFAQRLADNPVTRNSLKNNDPAILADDGVLMMPLPAQFALMNVRGEIVAGQAIADMAQMADTVFQTRTPWSAIIDRDNQSHLLVVAYPVLDRDQPDTLLGVLAWRLDLVDLVRALNLTGGSHLRLVTSADQHLIFGPEARAMTGKLFEAPVPLMAPLRSLQLFVVVQWQQPVWPWVGLAILTGLWGIGLGVGARVVSRFAMSPLNRVAQAKGLAHWDEMPDEITKLKDRLAQWENAPKPLLHTEKLAQIGAARINLEQNELKFSEDFRKLICLTEDIISADILERKLAELDRLTFWECLDTALAHPGQLQRREVALAHGEMVMELSALCEQAPWVDFTLQDITTRKRMQERLDGTVAELSRSNAELEQFAYVASHDLRQPLRTVRSYVGLLEEAFEDRLDAETREFMGFVRGGVKRMDALIVDLLTYSRVGRTSRDGPVESGRACDLALMDLASEVDAAGAQTSLPPQMPVVWGDLGEMTRLFQNLIGNAIKYRRQNVTARVEVELEDQGDFWCFTISDNGIGIPAQHRDRVFGIFQRLHGRDEYEGTGIGLAICRKVVERHGGRIWVDGNAFGGATIRFSWPKMRRDAGSDINDGRTAKAIDSIGAC